MQEFYSKLELQEHILYIAEAYSILSEFYFVNRIDFRGRIYCTTNYLNYQSCELSKSLLLFSKPSLVSRFDNDAENYLKIFGSNCYGNQLDKKSFQDRITWVDNNTKDILNYENEKLISTADNKFLFTAFCIEYKRWYNFYYNSNDILFKSFLPIQLDASCNGFQYLVLLTKELELWDVLNLSEKSFKDLPGDFYSFIKLKFEDNLNKLILNNKTPLEYKTFF